MEFLNMQWQVPSNSPDLNLTEMICGEVTVDGQSCFEMKIFLGLLRE
jgi:hypothetical protein